MQVIHIATLCSVRQNVDAGQFNPFSKNVFFVLEVFFFLVSYFLYRI
jgi:hypothetical protein